MATKMLRGMSVAGYVTLGNFSCNLWRNKIARKVAGKLAYLRGSLSKTGPLRFGSENQFPLNFAREYVLVQK